MNSNAEVRGVDQLPEPVAPVHRPVYAALKRLFDIVMAGVGLVLVSPVLALVAIAVRLDSPGPVLFRQERVGRNFKAFWILKFRTMTTDAGPPGAQLTVGADPRITRVGRWLRKTKIDELPQLANVLVGDMSIVGPRPEVPKYVEMFRADYAVVLSVRPGLTDPASIKYRDEAALLAASANPEQEYICTVLPEKIAIARDYIARATFASDLAVIARTLLGIAR
jgi:lipopolysaccharide/colanic/teichoic acid biosynthesis glycosyltransferase